MFSLTTLVARAAIRERIAFATACNQPWEVFFMSCLKLFLAGAVSACVFVAGYSVATDYAQTRQDRFSAAALFAASTDVASALNDLPATDRAHNFRAIVERIPTRSEFELIGSDGTFVARNATTILVVKSTPSGISCIGAPNQSVHSFCVTPEGEAGK